VRRWSGRQAWHNPRLGGRFNAGEQRSEMTGIRKGNPCGTAMYTSLTCLVHFLQKVAGGHAIAKRERKWSKSVAKLEQTNSKSGAKK